METGLSWSDATRRSHPGFRHPIVYGITAICRILVDSNNLSSVVNFLSHSACMSYSYFVTLLTIEKSETTMFSVHYRMAAGLCSGYFILALQVLVQVISGIPLH